MPLKAACVVGWLTRKPVGRERPSTAWYVRTTYFARRDRSWSFPLYFEYQRREIDHSHSDPLIAQDFSDGREIGVSESRCVIIDCLAAIFELYYRPVCFKSYADQLRHSSTRLAVMFLTLK